MSVVSATRTSARTLRTTPATFHRLRRSPSLRACSAACAMLSSRVTSTSSVVRRSAASGMPSRIASRAASGEREPHTTCSCELARCARASASPRPRDEPRMTASCDMLKTSNECEEVKVRSGARRGECECCRAKSGVRSGKCGAGGMRRGARRAAAARHVSLRRAPRRTDARAQLDGMPFSSCASSCCSLQAAQLHMSNVAFQPAAGVCADDADRAARRKWRRALGHRRTLCGSPECREARAARRITRAHSTRVGTVAGAGSSPELSARLLGAVQRRQGRC